MKPLCLNLIFASVIAVFLWKNSNTEQDFGDVASERVTPDLHGSNAASNLPETVSSDADSMPMIPLREAFLQNLGSTELLRFKGEFYSSWQEKHAPAVILQEIADPAAPPSYVDFLGRTLRNALKKNVLENPAEVIGKLRGAVGNVSLSRESRSYLARALIDLDESPETIRHINTLLQESRSDSEAVRLVKTLSRSREELALEALRSFRRDEQTFLDSFPLTRSALNEIKGL